MSLVEILVALAIGAGVMVVATQMMDHTTNSIDKAKQISERDRLVRQLQSSLADKTTLLRTAQRVPVVGACVLPNDGRICTGPTSATRQIQIPYDSKANGLIPRTGKLYGPGGEPNKPKGWRVNVWFYATCPNNAATCAEARTAYLRFQVVREPNSSVDPKINSVPLETEFNANKSQFVVAHEVGGLLGLRRDQACPANSFQVGTDGTGTVICQCRDSMGSLVGPNGSCSLASLICRIDPANDYYEMMVGMERDGRPICARTRMVCGNINFDQTKGSENCPNAGWLISITLGVCRAVPAGKKASGARPIECSTNRGRCCWYALF